jgi:hypothetical protein
VTELWVGDKADPPLSTGGDVRRAILLAVVSGVAVIALAIGILCVLSAEVRS